tara:strand:- start:72 stop:437 length:366 start_codon:yes stop_codon:yes gene_type:complete
MSDKYDDYTVWKEVYCEEFHELVDRENLTPQGVYDIGVDMINRAEAQGLENCSLVFSSQFAGYDDYLDFPTVSAKGYRKINSEEKAEQDFKDEVAKLAYEKGIPYYQARNYMELKREGVIE